MSHECDEFDELQAQHPIKLDLRCFDPTASNQIVGQLTKKKKCSGLKKKDTKESVVLKLRGRQQKSNLQCGQHAGRGLPTDRQSKIAQRSESRAGELMPS